MKYICADCNIEFRIVRNGVAVVPMFSQPPQPYQLWQGDLWECPRCGHRIVSGLGHKPIAEHFEPEFATKLASRGTDYRFDVYERLTDIPGGV